MIQALLCQAVMLVGVYMLFGAAGLGMHMARAAIATGYLAIAEYMMHYGLERQKVSSNKYEPVQVRHSWNSGFALENGQAFNVWRHSEHHMVAAKPYDQLGVAENAPMAPLPSGWLGLIALLPPVWFYLMNPLATAARQN